MPSSARDKYSVFTKQTYTKIPQITTLSDDQRFAIDVVSTVLPFKVNNYVIDQLINWDNVPDDPMYILTFPQQEMLRPNHFEHIADLLRSDADSATIKAAVNNIRMELNPHPAGQLEHNVPTLYGESLQGLQHKYKETVLFFPSRGQTCHAYCTFCFRWPQFVGMNDMKFAMRQTKELIEYLQIHSEVTDVLFTGGDPLIMKTHALASYIDPLLETQLEHIKTLRIGSKALSYWPNRFVTDEDADDLLRLFERVITSGKHLALMAHVNHPRELETPIVQEAIQRIRNTGVVIRTQSPLMKNINDKAAVWSDMWRKQVKLGMVPYYMFLARDTGAQHYFAVSLSRAHQIFRDAYRQVSGLSRTVRGPSMSAHPGKVHIVGEATIGGEDVFVLEFLQARNPDWVGRPFFAEYNEEAIWLDDLKPAFGKDQFFYEHTLPSLYPELEIEPLEVVNLETNSTYS